MSFRLFGIMATQDPDKKGEIINIQGVNLDHASIISDEHSPGNFSTVGAITAASKVMNEKEADTPRKKICWDIVNGPFIYFEGTLMTGDGHQNADASAAIIKFANTRKELAFKVGASIEGLTLRRASYDKKSKDYNHILSSIAEGVALTVRPCNNKCSMVFPWNTLEKADAESPMTNAMMDRVMFASDSIPTFIERPSTNNDINTLRQETMKMFNLLQQLSPEILKKSLDDWDKGGTSNLKCHACGHMETLFKTSTKWPNRCNKCGTAFTMATFWSAFNQ